MNIALSLAGILLALFISEGTLRLVKPPSVFTSHIPCSYRTDAQIGYRYEPNGSGWLHKGFEIDNFVRFNSAGFHDTEHAPAGDGGVRIAVAGDSFTAALEVPTADTWTQVLQQTLRQAGYPALDVINLGLDGTGTDIHLTLLKDYLAKSPPDLVILAFFRNDISDMAYTPLFRACYRGYVLYFQNEGQKAALKALVDGHGQRRLAAWLFKNSYAYRTLLYFSEGASNLFANNYIGPYELGQSVQNSSPPDVDLLFQELAGLSQEYGFQLLILPIPSKNDVNDSLLTLQQHLSTKTLAGLTILDTASAMTRTLAANERTYAELFWVNDGHFNADGNRIFGLAVAEMIRPYLEAQLSAER
ncbi:MAG: SGNH/GDSL hydrolase family protein [Anaerolineae bacterium]